MNNFLKKNLEFFFYFIPIFFLFPQSYLTIFSVLFIILSLYLLKKNNLKIKYDILDKILFFFFILIIYSSLKFQLESKIRILDFDIIKSISLLRFFLIYVLIKNLASYNFINFKKFFYVSLVCCLFLSINIISIHMFGQDFFGNKKLESINRYSSIFGDRAVAGSYILNFFFFGIIYLYYVKHNFLLKFFFLIITSLGILLTFDRSPYILFVFSLIFLGILNLKYNPKFFFAAIIAIFLNIIISFNYKDLKIRNASAINSISKFTKNFVDNKNQIKGHTYQYYEIYNESLSIIFYSYTFFGSGARSFPKRCTVHRQSTNPESIDLGYALACPRHSHNLYLEIAVSSGLIGFAIFTIFLILKTKTFVDKGIVLFKQKSENFIIFTFLLVSFITELMPRPYGNVFNTYNGFFIFFKLAFVYALIKQKKFI